MGPGGGDNVQGPKVCVSETELSVCVEKHYAAKAFCCKKKGKKCEAEEEYEKAWPCKGWK